MANGKFICDKNLGLLLEMLNKDAESYKDDYMDQYQHYVQTVKLLNLQPDQHRLDAKPLLELVAFLSSASSHYPAEAASFASSVLDILRNRSTGLDSEVRLGFCKSLVVLRNRKIVNTMEMLDVFFNLLLNDDKHLRKFICGAVLSVFKKITHERRKDVKLLTSIQTFLFSKLKDSRSIIVRCAQIILIDAFRKAMLRDEKTSNALAECCFHRITRIQVTAMKFFLGTLNDYDSDGSDEGSDAEENGKDSEKTLKQVVCAFRAAKKTRKKKKDFEKAKKLIGKERKSKKDVSNKFCNVIAIRNIHDPQGFTDRVFGQLEGRKNEKFEIRLLTIALVARLIGTHKLQTLGFYSFLHRYLQPKQREVTRMLLYAAQACHEFIPPDVIEQLVYVIAQNFVSDRNSSEAITVGLNAIREIFANCPLAASEDMLRDLVEYKTYKNKNVSMAARSLTTLFRTVNPKLLHRKDRGRPTEASKMLEIVGFGVHNAKTHVIGAECLPRELDGSKVDFKDDSDSCSETSIDEALSSLSEEDVNNTASVKDAAESGLSRKSRIKSFCGDNDAISDGACAKAVQICEERILTATDFEMINAFRLKKQLNVDRNRKNDDVKLDEELEEKISRKRLSDGLSKLKDIEKFHKKIHRQDKEERMDQVKDGRDGREEFGKPKKRGSHIGRTNRELAKNKTFQMVRHKMRGKNRQRSFRDRQESLRKYLLRQSGRKV